MSDSLDELTSQDGLENRESMALRKTSIIGQKLCTEHVTFRFKVCRLESKCTYSEVVGEACGLKDSLDV